MPFSSSQFKYKPPLGGSYTSQTKAAQFGCLFVRRVQGSFLWRADKTAITTIPPRGEPFRRVHHLQSLCSFLKAPQRNCAIARTEAAPIAGISTTPFAVRTREGWQQYVRYARTTTYLTDRITHLAGFVTKATTVCEPGIHHSPISSPSGGP